MICQVIVHDFDTGRKMVYVLDDADFAFQIDRWNDGDPLLEMVQDKALFAGRYRWCDLTQQHFHLMIMNMLNIIVSSDTAHAANADHPMTRRMVFLFCGLVHLLQQQTGGEVDTIKVQRIGRDCLLYDISASIVARIERPSSRGLRLVPN